MVEVKLSYNPFEAKTTLEYKGKPEALSCFGDGKNSRLQEWLYDFFPDLKKKHNLGEGSECKVSFYGTPGDFDDLGIARETFLRDNPGIQLDLQHLNPESKQLASRLRDLKALFERMQRESPYEELRDTKLKPRFERAVNSEFEISVIATMSSGKSTLINAILGQEVLPARNEATTAKIARIRDVDGKADFTVRGFKRNGEELVPVPPKVPATPQVLEEMNDQEKSKDIALIELEGNIPNIKSREMRLILSDTPGPNNSKDQEHAKHIDELIKDDTYKPMIMYILNATQLEINDDKELLEKIATAMGKSGKQSKDRFLFVLNKADELDPGKKECVEKAIENCKAYLKNNFEICDARIFPASAFLAKVIRKARGKLRSEGKEPGYDLTENEEDFLPKIQRFVNTEKRHLSNFSDLSPSCKKQQGVMLQDAIAKNDQAAQAEIYSGIPAIELAINEYLDKYAITTKINQAIFDFNSIVTKLDLRNKTRKALAENKSAREEVSKQLKEVKTTIEKGSKAKDLAAKFDEDIKKIQGTLGNSFASYEDEVNLFFTNEYENYSQDEVSPEAAQLLIKATTKKMELKYADISSSLTRLFEEGLKKQAEQYLADYQRYIKGLINTEGFVMNATLNLISLSIPDSPDAIVERFKDERQEKIGTREIDTGKRWYKPWTWFKDKQYEDVYKTEKFVKTQELYRNSVAPQRQQFTITIDNARKIAEENAQGLKGFFAREIGKLDKLLGEAIDEEQESLATDESLKQKIKENVAKADWLENFIADLNKVISI